MFGGLKRASRLVVPPAAAMGAAAAGAVVFVGPSSVDDDKDGRMKDGKAGAVVAMCERPSSSSSDGGSIRSMLNDIKGRVESIERTLGGGAEHGRGSGSSGAEEQKYRSDAVGPRGSKPGIDVVLGSQWGDEGKGKLVDMLSQVS